MSMLRFTAASLAIAAMTGLSTAQDQNRTLGNQTPSTQTDQSDRYEARRASTGQSQQGMTVKHVIVQKLQKANEAEIELAQLAQKKTQNEQVRQFTQTLIQDHQAINQQLQQMASQGGAQSGQRGQGQQAGQRNQLGQTDQQNQAGQRSQLGQSDQPGQQGQRRQGQRQQQSQAGNQAGRQGLAAMNRQSDSAMVPQELIQIAEKACSNALEMTKEMLNEQEGQDFEMAFLGQQVVAHTMMLAELKAIQNAGPQELQSVVEQAISKTESHRNKAKEIAKGLKNQRG